MTDGADGNGFILNVAFTGAVSDKARNPAVPYTVAEIAADAAGCARLGATMGHFHVRGPDGAASSDPAAYADLFAGVRAEAACRGMILVASTSGRHGQTLDQRMAVLRLPQAERPDMASLTLSSLNFPTGASVTGPDEIRTLAREMQAQAVRPELEVFDLGMAAFLHRLADEGLVEPPFYVNVILGNVAGAQADALSVGALLAALPAGSVVSLGGIGRAQMAAHLIAAAQADGVRTGLEDNLRLPGGKALASNPALTGIAADLARLAGRRLARPDEVRRRLGLKPSA